jgi:hypothetical protein
MFSGDGGGDTVDDTESMLQEHGLDLSQTHNDKIVFDKILSEVRQSGYDSRNIEHDRRNDIENLINELKNNFNGQIAPLIPNEMMNKRLKQALQCVFFCL